MMLTQTELTGRLRDRVIGDLHLSRLHAGDRLPGVREVAEELGVGIRAAVRAYRTLEEEGLVEVRSRSGVYVAPQERLGGQVLEETATWMADTLVEALKRRLTIPDFPEFVRRCTATVQPRVALLESTEDHLAILAAELRDEYGFTVQPVHLRDLPEATASGSAGGELPEVVRSADLIVTTAFHAHVGRAVADSLGKPLVVLTIHPTIASALERRLRAGSLTVVCVDTGIALRLLAIFGDQYAERIRVVLADDEAEVAALDPAEPVLLTLAAHRKLGESPLRNLLPHSPSISPASGRELTRQLIRLNILAERNRT